jgi:hypothetical protein
MAGNRFSKAAQDSVLGQLIDNQLSQGEMLNALDFIESPSGLGMTLYPVQRVIVRCMFGIPFDYRPLCESEGPWKTVPIYDKFRDNLLREFTGPEAESDYLKWVFDEGRCNVEDWRDIPEDGFREAAIFAGRRGGKSQIVSAIGAYALYKLLHIRSPQDYYKLREGSPIDFTFLAQDENGAGRIFAKLREDANNTPFFKPYLKSFSTTMLGFCTEADRDKTQITPTVLVSSLACTSNAVRSPSSVVLVLDEFAHFRSDKGSNSDEVYEAATPATMQFVNPEGKREALILSISSPWKKMGKMYDIHVIAMAGGVGSGIFTMRVGTAEMNPRADSEFLYNKYKTSALTWKAEYGGSFLESSETYVSVMSVDKCKVLDKKNVTKFSPDNLGYNYFWGLDLGMKNDATALAIGHLEVTPRGIMLVYDYIDRMMVGEAFEGPGVPTGDGLQRYVNHKELVLEEIAAWLVYMNNVMPCYRGQTDQHGGRLLVQLLHILGVTKMEGVHLNSQINSQMYFTLKGYIDQGLCSFPQVPKFFTELKSVEAEFINKYQIRVQAPEEKGAHDDMCDAAALVALLAQQYLDTDGRLKLDPTGQSLIMQRQQALPPKPILNIEAISIRDLQVLERMKRIGHISGTNGVKPIVNPFHRRG